MDTPPAQSHAKAPLLRRALPRRWQTELKRWRAGQPVREPLRSMFSAVDILRALLYQLGLWRVQQRAAGVAFFVVIGLVPTLMLLVVVADMFGLSERLGEFLVSSLVRNFIPLEADTAQAAVSRWVTNARTRTAGGIGLVVAAYSAFNVYGGIHLLLNDLWQVPRRGRMRHQITSALYSGAGLPILLALNTIGVAWAASQLVVGDLAGKVLSFVLMLVLAFAGLKLIVKSNAQTRYVLRAALIGTVAFELSKYVFAFYVTQILTGSWFVIYGAIFLLPVFMLWCFVGVMIAAVTASLAWVLQERESALRTAGVESPYTIHDASFDSEN